MGLISRVSSRTYRNLYKSLPSLFSPPPKMAKRTKKVGIVGKYGTRYGASLRKLIKRMEVSQHATYINPYTGTQTLKRHSVGIWVCKKTGVKIAGGAYMPETVTAKTVKCGLKRLRDNQAI